MKTALLIQNYPSASERIKFMWPFWKKSGFDLFGVDTEDGQCHWPEQIPTAKIARDGYINMGHLPKKLTDCFRWFIQDSLFCDYTHCCVIENDTLILSPPDVDLRVSAILAGGKMSPMRATEFYHNPWWLSRAGCAMFVECADELLRKGRNEFGNPDFFFGYVWETIGERPSPIFGFTQNHIFEKWQIDLAIDAVKRGCWAIHGIKSKEILDRILA